MPFARNFGRCILLLLASCEAKYIFHRQRNYTGLEHSGFAVLSDVLPGSLLLTRFGAAPFVGQSEVTLLNLTSGEHTAMATTIDWPNVPTVVDESAFGFKAALVGAGFIVPSHTLGGIWIIELSEQPRVLKEGPVKVTADKKHSPYPDSGWFYHKAHLVDMNNDGRLDILTSRCEDSVEPWNPKGAELVWLEQPAHGALDGTPWREHVIMQGPDFLFEVAPAELSGTGMLGVCAAEYLAKRLVYIEGSTTTGFRSRVVDADLGPGFSCRFADLNGDGRMDLIATNHLNKNGSVFAYSWEGSLIDSSTVVERHVLASGYSATSTEMGKASPGDAIPFFPRVKNTASKPLIAVSADNGNYLDVLIPEAPHDPSDWTYRAQFVEYVGADVGRMAIGDTDGDGMVEIFVPAYDLGQVVQYKIEEVAEEAPSRDAGSAAGRDDVQILV
mmetsp:Transcript_52482/g.125411  ORF Transcript_52482/g.125411 Transcript_52482/m.125411 type:complete len:443 (+) Transcript_52482:110-1438(+)|eukprot:CAMPEP_0178411064 /NCGR_PEP_ID=MMETSP0689_2-20121128/21303_1 /TAXON_ID=160604 /ORGANISM="Amphidinium massartii, Strain CS-259" /LENGTH=442 /DNA_ID=CAMNT_0020032261 /DNA_START=28 /DNA_END=1356 /DNA_ORIENTATION=+